jgi:MFS family permease
MSSWKRVALAMFAVGWGANQFTSLLVVYRDELGLSTQTRAALFGVYAIGLVPGLLAGGGASDRWGRRAVSTPFVILSPVATTILVVGREEVWGLAAGRFLAGVCSGVVFSVTSAWVAELSAGAADGDGARRTAIALSAGFGAGPLVSGLVAQFAPHPLWAPYVPHLVLGTVAALLVLPAPETVRPGGRAPRAIVRIPDVARSSRFVLTVAPAAPWVFGAAAVSIAFLPGEIGGDDGYAVAFAAVLSGLTLGTGVLVQPLARALDARRPGLAGLAGLAAAAAGTLLGGLALTLDSHAVLLVTGFVLGAAYGLCLVSGLRDTERLAPADERGATVAVYYVLTYLGFAAPYALGALSGAGLGDRGALLVATATALLAAAVVSVSRHRLAAAAPTAALRS